MSNLGLNTWLAPCPMVDPDQQSTGWLHTEESTLIFQRGIILGV